MKERELEVEIYETNPLLREYQQLIKSKDREAILGFLDRHPELISFAFSGERHKTIFHFAVKNNDLELFNRLYEIKPEGFHYRDRVHRTPYFYAPNTNNIQMIARMIELGAEVDALDRKSFTPFYESVVIAKTKTCEFLLAHGANVNIQTEMGRTPLIKAGRLISLFMQAEETEDAIITSCNKNKRGGQQQPERTAHGLLGKGGWQGGKESGR